MAFWRGLTGPSGGTSTLAFTIAAQQIGLSSQAGLHTGEIEFGGDSVHAAARVVAHSTSNEGGIAGGHRPWRRSGPEMLPTWIAQTYGTSRLGFVCRKLP